MRVKKRALPRVAARSGRPPRERAGEVDNRILAAAQRVFLDQGFEGASIDEIATVARAGKPTIYARHPSKEALFTAVVLRDIAERLQFENIEAMGTTLEERFTVFGERAQIGELVVRLFNSFAESQRIILRPNATMETFPDAARLFIDLIFLPMILRALLGEPLEALRAEIPDHVANRVAIFLSVCSR
jgi:AcrR family transcriptional regulator